MKKNIYLVNGLDMNLGKGIVLKVINELMLDHEQLSPMFYEIEKIILLGASFEDKRKTSINSSPVSALLSWYWPENKKPAEHTFKVIMCAFLMHISKKYGDHDRQKQLYESAFKKAIYAIRDISALDLAEQMQIIQCMLSCEKNAIDEIINNGSTQADINDLKSLRSLHNLAIDKRKIRGINKTYEVFEAYGDYEDEVYYQDIVNYEDNNTPEPDQVARVELNAEDIAKEIEREENLSPSKKARQTFANMIGRAAHLARQNNYCAAQKRFLEQFFLEEIIFNATNSKCSDAFLLLLLPLLTGRKVSEKSVSDFKNAPKGFIVLETNSPISKPTANSVPVVKKVLLRVPMILEDAVEKLKQTLKNKKLRINDIDRLIKNELSIMDNELTVSKLEKYLALRSASINQLMASIIFGKLSSIDATKSHYLVYSLDEVQRFYYHLWDKIFNEIGFSSLKSTDQPSHEVYVGSNNFCNQSKVDEWLQKQSEVTNYSYKESELCLYRSKINPRYDCQKLERHKNVCQILLINDKDRGNNGQFSRMVFITKADLDELIFYQVSYKQECLKKESNINAHIPGEKLGYFSPKYLTKELSFPGHMNQGRKHQINKLSRQLPSQIVGYMAGWMTHGLVPFSSFSTMSPMIIGKYLHDFK